MSDPSDDFRQTDGCFSKGNPGGPGRPRGHTSRMTTALLFPRRAMRRAAASDSDRWFARFAHLSGVGGRAAPREKPILGGGRVELGRASRLSLERRVLLLRLALSGGETRETGNAGPSKKFF
jgi:hypothetical protein